MQKSIRVGPLWAWAILLTLQGCAAAKLASLAGKSASAGKVATAAKVGVAAEGASVAARAARGGEAAAAAGHLEQAGSGAAKVAVGAEEGATASRLGEAAGTAIDLAGIDLPEGQTEKFQANSSNHRWRLSQGRSLEALRGKSDIYFELRGFTAPAIPRVEVTLESVGGIDRLTSTAQATQFRLESANLPASGARLSVKLRSGNQSLALPPWTLP